MDVISQLVMDAGSPRGLHHAGVGSQRGLDGEPGYLQIQLVLRGAACGLGGHGAHGRSDKPDSYLTPVTWTASATGGTGPYTYRFFVWNGASWTVGQDWSSSRTFVWIPPAAGSYQFQVWIRNAGSGATYDAWRGAGPYTASSWVPLSVSNFSADRAFPVPAGMGDVDGHRDWRCRTPPTGSTSTTARRGASGATGIRRTPGCGSRRLR